MVDSGGAGRLDPAELLDWVLSLGGDPARWTPPRRAAPTVATVTLTITVDCYDCLYYRSRLHYVTRPAGPRPGEPP